MSSSQRGVDSPEIASFANELTGVADELAASMGRGGGEQRRAADPAIDLDLVMRIPVTMKVVVGSTTLPVSELTKLQRGDLVPLDRKVGDPVEIVVNGRIVARGQMVIVDERTSQFGVTLTEVGELPASRFHS